ncbi:hypothetical protein CMI37_01875 [Candidatus Pacearchaeota archaeon]|nr:hypothetical protein [Candidatus Pacearchaeota archaeon]|tara:strand:- start:1009 stop:1362 length:354 start_codon:yes stop_codon:yes gene_type:complete
MGRNQVERKRRISWVHKLIKDTSAAGLGINEEFLIAERMVEWGVSRRTMVEYVNALIRSDRVVVDERDGELYTKIFHDVLRKKREIMTEDSMEANKILQEQAERRPKEDGQYGNKTD